MRYKRYQDVIMLRLDPEEEICASLLDLAGKEEIRGASVSGLGAIQDFTTEVYDTAKKQFRSNRFQGDYEVTSLVGTLARLDGALRASPFKRRRFRRAHRGRPPAEGGRERDGRDRCPARGRRRQAEARSGDRTCLAGSVNKESLYPPGAAAGKASRPSDRQMVWIF